MSLIERVEDMNKRRHRCEEPKINVTQKLIEGYNNMFIMPKLLEAYRTPNLYWVKDFVDSLYSDSENLLKVCDKYKVDFVVEKDSIGEDLINGASYGDKSDKYTIRVPLQTIKKIDNGLDKKELEIELMEFLVHEETHRQQNQLRNIDQPYYDMETTLDIPKYLSQKVEIDANARGIGYELKTRFPDKDENELIKKVIQNELDGLSNKLNSTVFFYRRIGGKVWRLFLKELYEYFYYKGDLGLADYNKWLADHKN